MSAPAPFLSRHLGDYLLVAQLSEDPLGTVFRALYAADERRFVRLRVLQSESLAPEAIFATVQNDRLRGILAHDAIVVRPELDVVDGIPFMTWDETAGWTLDTMLARVRAFGIRIPVEYALLIVERIAEALEHAHQTAVEGRPVAHGLLWPGFVSISHDAVVRVGGFGVADAILPSLGASRLTTEISPYVAPESRRDAKASISADVYSLGAILVELLTGRRPSLETPSAELRASDPRSEELSGFLRRCLADPAERFPTAIEAHRALQQLVTGNPFSLFTANLALFLYKLLNPESQSVAPSSDWESTSPVVVETTKTRRAEESVTAAASATGTAPRRRRGDLDAIEENAERESARPVELAAPAPAPLLAPPPTPAAAVADAAPAPLEILEQAAALIEAAPEPRAAAAVAPLAWKRPALLLAAAAGLTAGVFLVAGRAGTPPTETPPKAAGVAAAPTVEPAPAPAAPAPEPSPAPAPVAVAAAVPATAPPAPARPARKIHPELKQPAEDQRYRAALARVEADRLSARQNAPEAFELGERNEKEGMQLLHDREYDAAQLAFSRAAKLFEEARDRSWEERVRNASLTR
ncbi:MAG TPA: protein kinase [Thermoanaerobaculia bacterium]|nr:protein kinase [Thermoanaerobaculia bacterium]